ncbi:WD domain, G-beta repeat [Plasmodiophora brassicae]
MSSLHAERIPLLYDAFVEQTLEWPSYACCWGQTQGASHRLYMSRSTSAESTGRHWKGPPNAIETYDVDLGAAAKVAVRKRIVHPGEVNRIKVCRQFPDIIATHSDCPDVYVWNVETQRGRDLEVDSHPNEPDVILKGHTSNATYALDFAYREPLIISGGSDNVVCLWSLEDDVATVPRGGGRKPQRLLECRMKFQGHTKSVEDCVFNPDHQALLASVGDDCDVMVWDARTGTKPVAVVRRLHATDINAIDWNRLDANFLVTGASDKLIKIVDMRLLSDDDVPIGRAPKGPCVQSFDIHEGPVTNVQWSATSPTYFASSSEDGHMFVFDRLRHSFDDGSGVAPELVLRHEGHGSMPVVNFDWNSREPWLMASVSDDAEGLGGGTLQVWKISDLLTAPEGDVRQMLQEVLS